jgi:large subunit ribosomal protein L13
MKFYDANNQILGRISSVIAKDLLNGEKVIVVNCEKVVMSGNPRFVLSKYLDRISRGDIKHGPFFPKTPDRIFRRAVRGMLPRKKAKGRIAFKNLKAFIGLPEEFKGKNFEKIKTKDAGSLKTKYVTLGEISTAIGARKRW